MPQNRKVPSSHGRGSARRASTCALAIVTLLLAGLAAPGASLALAPPPAVANLAIAAVEGQPYSSPVATVTYSGSFVASEFTATIEWGDGTTNSAVVSGAGSEFTISPSPPHTYAEEGSFSFAVKVTWSNGIESTHGSDTTTITVADAPISAPSSAPTTFSGAGAAGTGTGLNVFQAAIGGSNNGTTAGERQAGFRRIDWDGIPLDGSAPGTTAISPGKTVALAADSQQERGLELDSPLAVSGDSFASINPEAGGLFTPFSAADLAAPFNTDVLALNVRAPAPPGGTPTPAATRGLGVVFLNVRLPNTTSIEYFNGDALLGRFFAPVGGHDQPSFLGVLFDSPVITRVAIALGTAEILNFDGGLPSAGLVTDGSANNNLVAADDVVLAEPAPDRPTLNATAGTPFADTLATFQDANPGAGAGDFLATIDWGDGSRTAGVIAADASGHFTVSGAHTYAQAGTFPATIAVHDLGGAHATFHATLAVTPAASIPPPAPVPGPISIRPPHCTLAGTLSAKLALIQGRSPAAMTAAVSARKKPHHTPNHLRASASCDEDASVKLTATATLTAAGKKGHKATASTKTTAKTLSLGQTTASLTASHPATLTIALSPATLAKLKTATRQHQRISVRLTLAATNAHGTATAVATVAALKL